MSRKRYSLAMVVLLSSTTILGFTIPRQKQPTTTKSVIGKPCSTSFSTQSILFQRPTTTTTTTSLFGIKGFRAWFETQFPDAIVNINPNKNKKSNHEATDSFDHVLVDMNQIIHVILRRSRNDEHAVRMLMSEMDRLLEMVTPIQSLVLAIDGPPAGK